MLLCGVVDLTASYPTSFAPFRPLTEQMERQSLAARGMSGMYISYVSHSFHLQSKNEEHEKTSKKNNVPFNLQLKLPLRKREIRGMPRTVLIPYRKL